MTDTRLYALISDATVQRIEDTIPSIPVVSGRRAEISREERPIIVVDVREINYSAEDAFIGQTKFEAEVTISAFPSPAVSDAGCIDVLARTEEMMQNAFLGWIPSLQNVMMEPILFLQSEVEVYDAQQSAVRMGDVRVTMRCSGYIPLYGGS